MWVERTKWPDLPHYGSQGTLLGADDHGWWVGFDVHHPVYRGEQLLFRDAHATVRCISHHDWYMASWFLGHEFELYVDIVTPPVWSKRGATMVDVDFDVVVRGDTATLIDEDKFEEHRLRYGYPEELVAGARRAAADIFARIEARLPPFTPEDGARWHRRLAERTSS